MTEERIYKSDIYREVGAANEGLRAVREDIKEIKVTISEGFDKMANALSVHAKEDNAHFDVIAKDLNQAKGGAKVIKVLFGGVSIAGAIGWLKAQGWLP